MLRKKHYSKIYCTRVDFYRIFDLKVGFEQSFLLPSNPPLSLSLSPPSAYLLIATPSVYMYQQHWRECNKTETEQAETQATAVAQLLMTLQS